MGIQGASVPTIAAARNTPRAPARLDRRVLLYSMLAVFMAFLDATIVNVAFPAIHRSFATISLGDLSWVLNAYNVVIAATLVPAGLLIDRYGRRRGFFTGLLVFLGGSLLCGLAPSADALIAARTLQALGAAMLIPASFSVVLAACPLERRAMATSAWAAAGAVAAAAGPSLGGVLVHAAGWRWIFFVNLVLAVAMVGAHRVITESRDADRPLPDLLGTVLLALSIGSLALGIVKAPDWGWTGSETIACWSVAGLLAVALALRTTRHPAPVIEPELMRIRSFALSSAGFLVFSAGLYALLLGNILFLTEVWHYSVLRAGFAVTPGPLAAAVAAAIGGRLSEHFSPRVIALPGMAGFALACLLYRHVGPTPDYLGRWLPAQIPSGLSIGLVISSLTTASAQDLPPDRVATGSAFTACARQVGAVLGIAILIAIVSGATPVTALHSFRLAWLLMGSASVLAIVPAIGLVRRRVLTQARVERRIPGFIDRELLVHGSRIAYRIAGDGPPVVLLHGLLDDSLTWRKVAPKLARRYTVIVPDLPGHGRSGPASHGDYGSNGHAIALRGLLDALGYDRVALIGHSLGGSIALAFAFQNPDRMARLALISPGGFGRDVHPMLRIATTPVGGVLLRLVTSGGTRWCLRRTAGVARLLRLRRPSLQLLLVSRFLEDLAPAAARRAFLRTTAGAIDWRGQCGSAIDWIDAWRHVPTLLLWGTADRMIPAHHSFAIADAHPQAEVVLLSGVGHHAHRERSTVVGERLLDFLDQGPQTGRDLEPHGARHPRFEFSSTARAAVAA